MEIIDGAKVKTKRKMEALEKYMTPNGLFALRTRIRL
jgi:hypothetical protein